MIKNIIHICHILLLSPLFWCVGCLAAACSSLLFSYCQTNAARIAVLSMPAMVFAASWLTYIVTKPRVRRYSPLVIPGADTPVSASAMNDPSARYLVLPRSVTVELVQRAGIVFYLIIIVLKGFPLLPLVASFNTVAALLYCAVVARYRAHLRLCHDKLVLEGRWPSGSPAGTRCFAELSSQIMRHSITNRMYVRVAETHRAICLDDVWKGTELAYKILQLPGSPNNPCTRRSD